MILTKPLTLLFFVKVCEYCGLSDSALLNCELFIICVMGVAYFFVSHVYYCYLQVSLTCVGKEVSWTATLFWPAGGFGGVMETQRPGCTVAPV